MGTLASQPPSPPRDEVGEHHHPQDSPGSEGQEVGDRGRGGGEGQRREDSEEMGASGEAMERPDAQSGMGMTLSRRIMIPMGMGMDMQMGVGLAIVRVVVGVDVEAGGLTETPDTNPDQHRANETVAPSRDRLNGQGLAEAESSQPDERHTRGMAQSPA